MKKGKRRQASRASNDDDDDEDGGDDVNDEVLFFLGRTPKGSYSPRGRSRAPSHENPSQNPFLL